MKSYEEWQNERPAPEAGSQYTSGQWQAAKKWKATKPEIMQFWQNIRPNVPLAMTPIPYEHSGSTYQQDGIRITGSKEFIASTLARLKEFLGYETQATKLQLVFRETERPTAPGEKTTYVFYIQSKQRGPKTFTPGRPGAL